MISDEAVEAAAKEIHGDLAMTPWKDLGPITKQGYINVARLALESAAPYIAAQAWDEGRESVDFDSCGINPYRSQA